MIYAVTVRYRVSGGHEGEFERLFADLAALSRAEAGCLTYVPHRLAEDPGAYLLYESYVDEAAYQTHRSSEHFDRYVRQLMSPLIEERSIERLEIFDQTVESAI